MPSVISITHITKQKNKTPVSANIYSGFTLFELMMAIAITAIVLGIAAPAFAQFSKQLESRTAGFQLIGLINFIRGEAVVTGKRLTLCGTEDYTACIPGRNWGHQLMVFQDKDNDRQVDQFEKIERLFQFKSGSELIWRSFRNRSWLKFYPDGTTYWQNGNFTYCPKNKDAHYAKHFILSTNGRLYPATNDKNENGIVEGYNGEDIQC